MSRYDDAAERKEYENFMTDQEQLDVLIIGAGPSGAVAAALLVRRGYSVCVIEKEVFPRFSIGESLLPQCMEYIEEAGMMEAVQAAGFQHKNGAAFHFDGKHTDIDFREKFSPGWGTTFQVERATFDKILADEAQHMGADVRYGHEILSVDVEAQKPRVIFRDAEGVEGALEAKFLLDASGFGRVLPRLLDLNTPSDFPVRQALFTHVVDHIEDDRFDRNKILIDIHPRQRDVWYWLIPFGNGRASIGVVAKEDFVAGFEGDAEARLWAIVEEEPYLAGLLANAERDTLVREVTGYSANVKSLHGKNYALLGNAGEFLDPIFSSGVTIGMRSASMAATLVDQQLRGEPVDWEESFAKPLKVGVDSFRTYVSGWYDQRFQDVIFFDKQSDDIKAKIASILAGYAWDKANPFVRSSERRLNLLAQICRAP